MEQLYTIAVIGGTGKAGQYLVKELIRQGYQIKILLRNPGKFENENPLIEKIKGDVRNYQSVYSLVKGCNTVISTLGQPKGEALLFSIAAQNIIKAMYELNVKRYIYITGLTIETHNDKKSGSTKLKSKMMKICFPSIIADKQKEYEMVASSALDWTIIRVPFIELTNSSAEINISLTDCPGKKISSSRLAGFLVNQITDNQFIRQAPFIANKV
jgi:putative NADH-flavin reductase